MNFKSKLLEIKTIFFLSNSVKLKYNDYFFGSAKYFKFVSFLLYVMEVKRLKCAMLGAYTVPLL